MTQHTKQNWFNDWFGKDYLTVYAHRDDASAQNEVDFIIENLKLQKSERIFDMACGNGRHLRAFANRGFNASGSDLSAELLALARQANLNVSQQDMRSLPFSAGSFDLILSLFTSFGYFSDEENQQVLADVYRLLSPGGRFFLDFMNAPKVISSLVPRSERAIAGGTVLEERSFDLHSGRIEKRITLSINGESRSYMESVRAYSVAELEGMLISAGFSVQSKYGDFKAGAFVESSERLIIVSQKGLS